MSEPNLSPTDLWIAKNEICELQRLYAKATDLLCINTPAANAEATQIYHRIFTPDAVVQATGMDPHIGPDAWVELVIGALDEFAATQHLVGTQLAEVHSLPGDEQSPGKGTLFSHLQAWHAKPDGDMWHYIGIYESNVVCHAGVGWQIAEMNLIQVSEDYRKISPRP
jgi:hypothetical protein